MLLLILILLESATVKEVQLPEKSCNERLELSDSSKLSFETYSDIMDGQRSMQSKIQKPLDNTVARVNYNVKLELLAIWPLLNADQIKGTPTNKNKAKW